MIALRTITLLVFASLVVPVTRALAQVPQPAPGTVDPATHAQHVQQGTHPGGSASPSAPASEPPREIVDQINALRAEVAKLQLMLAAQRPASLTPANPVVPQDAGGRGMGAMPMGAMPQGAQQGMPQGMPQGSPGTGMSGMGSMRMDAMMQGMMGMMEGMSSMMKGMAGGTSSGPSPMPGSPAAGGMGMMDDNMPMMDQMMAQGMNRMGGGMSGGTMTSGLPGFPGASHIYHVGATGFFLDHGAHITLAPDQQQQLNQIKEAGLLEQATLERQIQQAEQELWKLTGADAPDAARIEAQLREIEKLRADQRLAFIRAVGKAAGMLTDDQRKQLTGLLPPNPAPAGQQVQPTAK